MSTPDTLTPGRSEGPTRPHLVHDRDGPATEPAVMLIGNDIDCRMLALIGRRRLDTMRHRPRAQASCLAAPIMLNPSVPHQTRQFWWLATAWLVACLATMACPASAQERGGHDRPGKGQHGPRASPSRAAPQLDQRHHHDHYYPPRGHVVPAVPGGAIGVGWGGVNWYYHGGVWFRPWGGRFVVGIPPIGIVVPLLPPSYVSLWIGGAPYYYANGLYYAPAPQSGYTVVPPPPGIDSAPAVPSGTTTSTVKLPPDPIIYPRNGQSAQQQEFDRQECNRWATTQPSAMADASVFQRAVAACMDGRGYTVR